MKHVANDGTLFDKIEDCLRYEGSCNAKNNDGVLWLLGLLAVVVYFAMRGM